MPKIPLNHKPEKEPKHKRCPKFEDAAASYLENPEDRERALEFAAWLRANRMAPSAGNSGYNWYVAQQGKRVCQLKMYDDTWFILTRWEIIDELIAREELKEVLWEHAFQCTVCNTRCGYGTLDLDLYGREVKNICRQYFLRICNPDAKTIELFKEFLLERGKNI